MKIILDTLIQKMSDKEQYLVSQMVKRLLELGQL